MQLGRVGCETAPLESAEWTFVVGRGFLAVVPASTASPVVAALHALAAETAVTLEALVSLIPLGGAGEPDAFAVIVPGVRRAGDGTNGDDPTQDGIPVHAVVRGAIAVDVFSIGGSRRFTDRNIRPWLLAEFQSVTGLVIGSPLAAVARSDRLAAGRMLGTGIDAGDTLFWSVAGGPDDTADTVLRPRRIVDDTVVLDRRMRDRVVVVAAGAPAVEPSDEPADPSAGESAAGSSADEPADRPGPHGFRLATGEVVRLGAVYRIGRSPRPRRIQPGERLELIVVASATALVSANHLEIRQDGDAVVVTDLGSTNGTLVHFPLGRTQRLRFGASLTVLPGTTVDIGDGNLIEILPAD
ncbi:MULTISPECIES: FHA domain-containing protein [unclassified Cryobacterium]|uniref:FHA domain-containing protein n=1 Tax=unclassified Cryobacterium TaxID=2649013 RepID=UPI001069C6D6|nr:MULTISPECIES: FHA domain-containing protein [unclassified Cryobacterium]TFC58873.1 FHA domain-containing protein [Cryobacterium sp. TMB3-1-2]TFC70507.1 FHA domain-containing protein [Cryobacterium sp. TMB3-15]TFC73864.1 FHA domain-containing protein [Cryobacterium sp. TMB3-10]TFD42085.1 FHA domain-containing protein [Cryobacterium sp. TMB3-12]